MHLRVGICVALLSIFFPRNVGAVTFTPTVIDVAVLQEAHERVPFTVGNTSEEAKQYTAQILSVQFAEASGELEFSALPDALTSWFVLDAEAFTLAPAESRIVTLTVSPAATADDATEIIALLFHETTVGEDADTRLATAISSLVFLTVGTPNVQSAVQSFVTPTIVSAFPIVATATFANSGERTLQPYGTVTFRAMSGAVLGEVDVNPRFQRIPSGFTRAFAARYGDGTAQQGFWYELWREVADMRIGLFTAELVAAPYPGAEATLHATSRFLVLPWRVALLMAAIVVSLVFFVRLRRRR